MASCLMAPKHRTNVDLSSVRSSNIKLRTYLQKSTSAINRWNLFKKYLSEISLNSPTCLWVNTFRSNDAYMWMWKYSPLGPLLVWRMLILNLYFLHVVDFLNIMSHLTSGTRYTLQYHMKVSMSVSVSSTFPISNDTQPVYLKIQDHFRFF